MQPPPCGGYNHGGAWPPSGGGSRETEVEEGAILSCVLSLNTNSYVELQLFPSTAAARPWCNVGIACHGLRGLKRSEYIWYALCKRGEGGGGSFGWWMASMCIC